ncbi:MULTISPECIES: hypothetical protein [Sorangium]|uniref:Uncharacterized protein n=1 Tax=Sorangium cellulosum TaxID=56 RepID=A0A4P2QP42_SORCE|nr:MULTISPECIES: hypothetical protein [Sorangium]AUX31914.1 uncharacterized protein SOCE836_040490 [Sorangium cellulosum]WCQ91288.1 hypothetical protein NQZ70_04004 [Sorangium sp. Soce836]
MPNFTARLVPSADITLQVWTDPPTGSAPSRLNPRDIYQHQYWRVALDSAVIVRATVNGVESPLDSALGGDLFTYHWGEWTETTPPPIGSPPGRSSVAVFTVSNMTGHYLLFVRRRNGGAVGLHFDVELVF